MATYTPPKDLVLPNQPTARGLGVCGLQFAGWGQRQFYLHLASHKYRGVQIFTKAELALHPNHFDYKAILDPELRQQALDYLMETMRLTGHTPTEISGHAALMAAIGAEGVIHTGFKQFLPEGVWVTRADGTPDVPEIQKRTMAEAGKIFEACVLAGIPVFNLFTGSSRAGKELPQFPHLPDAERDDIVGRDLETLEQMGEIAVQAGMRELNIENHREQIFHTTEEMVEFAIEFETRPKLRIFGNKSDMSHIHFTGGYAPDVIREVTARTRSARDVRNARRLGIAEGRDLQRNDGQMTSLDAELATMQNEEPYIFMRRMHAKFGLFRLGGRQSTHSQAPLDNKRGDRPNRFGAVDLAPRELWAETMHAYNDHGLPVTADVMIEHEDDATVGLTPGTTDIRLNPLFRVGEFCYDVLCVAAPAMTHQEAMAAKPK